MGCELVTLAQLKSQIPALSASYTDDAMMAMLDAAQDFIFNNLGHGFSQAIRIWHDESASATAATVQVTSTALVLVITGGTNAGTSTLLFATYDTLYKLVDAVNALNKGWVAALIVLGYECQPSTSLQVMAATSAFGYDHRQILCLADFTETLDGRGESHLFLQLPLINVSSVTEDDETLVADDDFWAKGLGYLIRMGSSGGRFSWYCRSTWSVRKPNNIVVKYIPKAFKFRPAALVTAIVGLVQLAASSTGYQSEHIGDYSYTKNGGADAAMWLSTLSEWGINLVICTGFPP